LGAAAASFGKLSGEACPSVFPLEAIDPYPYLPSWLTPQLACRSILLSLLLAANLSATGLLLKALARKLPSLQATVLSNASNIAATGCLGALLFGEPVTPRWVAGVATVGAGLWLISRAASAGSAGSARPVQRARPSTPAAARQPRKPRSD
jgi:drug/metabolite transporter (DMT)-like permease